MQPHARQAGGLTVALPRRRGCALRLRAADPANKRQEQNGVPQDQTELFLQAQQQQQQQLMAMQQQVRLFSAPWALRAS